METLFVGPSDPGEFIWGAGPLFVLPTAMDDRMRTDKLGYRTGGGGAVDSTPVGLRALVQNIWSVAGLSSSQDVIQMQLQYFVNDDLPPGWYLTASPIITAN